jgi:hypothetical protein
MGDQLLIYQACVGETPAFYQDCIRSVEKYAQRYGYAHIVQTEPILKITPLNSQRSDNALRRGYLPIYEKENAFAYLDDFDKVLILDADVFVRDSAPPIHTQWEHTAFDFAGVVEREMPLNVRYLDKIRKYSKGQYERLNTVNWKWNENGAEFFNMGVMLLNRSIKRHLEGNTPEQFIRRPEFERFVNGEGHWKWSTDQTLLNWWVKHTGMLSMHLDWKWNALYGAIDDVSEAHFVHFFLSAKMDRQGAEIPEIMRRI